LSGESDSKTPVLSRTTQKEDFCLTEKKIISQKEEQRTKITGTRGMNDEKATEMRAFTPSVDEGRKNAKGPEMADGDSKRWRLASVPRRTTGGKRERSYEKKKKRFWKLLRQGGKRRTNTGIHRQEHLTPGVPNHESEEVENLTTNRQDIRKVRTTRIWRKELKSVNSTCPGSACRYK